MSKPIIYFAGKIGPNDWRTKLFGGRVGAAPNNGENPYGFDRLLDETLTRDHGQFLYGGPFFISCDHGCAHGPNSHGAAPTGCLIGAADDGRLEMQGQIFQVNSARIRRADFIFAYVNELDCFGTLIEIGYAAALHKPICVGIGHNIKVKEFFDLWMTRQCHTMPCNNVLIGEPKEIFAKFLSVILPLRSVLAAA
jgi:hypothetical protein